MMDCLTVFEIVFIDDVNRQSWSSDWDAMHIQEVPASNLGPEIDYNECNFLCFP